MRESNFAFPAQNRASVSISSQLYDRRALDSNSALPLYNSLTHLTYLTSTSPRIREIMTYDGGLERLVQLLREFCLHPPPADSGALMYGLAPPPLRPHRRTPVLTPTLVDKNAQARFTLAFQSLVNIGVRGSEEIRGRVVQAGTLDVVGCILEAWLVSRGFSLGPSSSSSHPRETREQRSARRAAQAEARQRQQAAELERALRRQIDTEQRMAARQAAIQAAIHRARAHEIPPTQEPPPAPQRHASSTSTSEANSDTEPSAVVTPGHGTPTGVVTVPGRERSGTVIGRPEWETGTIRGRRAVIPADTSESSADASRAETETEDDAEGDVDMERSMTAGLSERTRMPTISPHVRRAVGIVTDQPEAGPSAATPSDPTHIIVAPETVLPGEGVGVEEGLVALESNDDFALGAPPGAPGAIDGAVPAPPTISPTPDRLARLPADTTPRAMMATLPPQDPSATPFGTRADLRTNPHQRATLQPLPVNQQNAQTNAANAHAYLHQHHQEHHRNEGPYRDEEVLLALQLLAYLSKYPHVRQAFYKPRTSFHPAAVPTPSPTTHVHGHAHAHQQPVAGSSNLNSTPLSERHSIFRAFASVRGRDKRPAPVPSAQSTFNQLPMQQEAPVPPQRVVNVFSLVERFTFRPSSSENEGYGGAGQLPPEIQYWAGVIMRNACRKDDTRGGIRQCANMLCGRWETFPREFAKCRRCRKAKYCGKECQSTAWSEGHRFWCSAKDADDEVAQAAAHGRSDLLSQRVVVNVVDGTTTTVPVMNGTADLNAEDVAVAGADQNSVPLQRTLVALNAMRQTLQAEQVDQAHRTTAPAAPAGAAAAAELMELLLRREQVAANAADAGTQAALPTGWDWAAAAAGVRMIQAGADDALPAQVQDDPFMDPVLQHGFFAPGGGPAGEGMTVEDGVVRVDNDIVRVEENLTLRPRGAMDGMGVSRTEDAMVLD